MLIFDVTIPPIGIASHELRRLVAEGRSIRYRVPRGVELIGVRTIQDALRRLFT